MVPPWHPVHDIGGARFGLRLGSQPLLRLRHNRQSLGFLQHLCFVGFFMTGPPLT